jgi:hypothetical protein
MRPDVTFGLAGGSRPVTRVPRPVVFALGKLSEYPLGALGRQSPVAVYRLKSALARLHYESDPSCSVGDRESACARGSGA